MRGRTPLSSGRRPRPVSRSISRTAVSGVSSTSGIIQTVAQSARRREDEHRTRSRRNAHRRRRTDPLPCPRQARRSRRRGRERPTPAARHRARQRRQRLQTALDACRGLPARLTRIAEAAEARAAALRDAHDAGLIAAPHRVSPDWRPPWELQRESPRLPVIAWQLLDRAFDQLTATLDDPDTDLHTCACRV